MSSANGDPAAQPLDDEDFRVLDEVRDLYQLIDPMPADLLDDVRFAVAVRHLEGEVARAVADLPATTARGDERRMLTFESEHTSITVTVRPDHGDTVRVDGWIVPREPCSVALRTSAGTTTTAADERGRFAFQGVPREAVHLTVRGGRTVTTPTFGL